MAVALRAVGTIVHGTTSAAPAYPAGIAAGDAVFLGAAWKLETATAPALTGWTKVVDQAVGSGTAGAGTGAQRVVIYRKDTVAGGETGTVTVTPSGSVNVVSGCIIAFSKGAGPWSITYDWGTDATAGANLSAPSQAEIVFNASDLMVGFVCHSANTNMGSSTFTAPSISFGTAVEHADAGTTNGNDQRVSWVSRPVTSGSPAVCTFTSTITGTITGGLGFIRLREVAATPVDANLSGSGSLSASVVPVFTRTGDLAGTSDLTATVEVAAAIRAADLTGSGVLTATASQVEVHTAALTGSGDLTGATSPAVTAALDGAGTLTATAATAVNAALAGSGGLSASVGVVYTRSTQLAGSGVLSAAVIAAPDVLPISGYGDLTAAVVLPAMSALVETFDTKNTLVWTWQGVADVDNGELTLPLTPTTDYGLITSTGYYDLTGSSVTVKLAQVFEPTAPEGEDAYGVTTTLFLRDDESGGSLAFAQVGSDGAGYELFARVGDGGFVFVPHDPVANPWLRIREDGGTVYIERSPDRVTWSVVLSNAAPASLKARVTISARDERVASTTHMIRWDHVNVEPPIPPATANLVGSGTLNAAVAVVAITTAALDGAGGLAVDTSAVTAAELTGASSLDVTSAPAGAAELAGAGDLAAGAIATFATTAPLAGSGALTATAVGVRAVTALVTGSGALTASVVAVTAVAAPLTGASALTGQTSVAVAATLDGTGTPTASVASLTAAALASSGALTAVTAAVVAVAAGLEGTGTLTVSNVSSGSDIARTGTLSGAGELTASVTGTVTPQRAAPLDGLGLLSAAVIPTHARAGVLSGSGSLTATVTSAVTPQRPALMSGTGTLSATVVAAYPRAADLSSGGVLAATVLASVTVTAELTGVGSLSVTVAEVEVVTAELTGAGQLGVTTQATYVIVASLTGTGHLAAVSRTTAGIVVAAVLVVAGEEKQRLVIAEPTDVVIFTAEGGPGSIEQLVTGEFLVLDAAHISETATTGSTFVVVDQGYEASTTATWLNGDEFTLTVVDEADDQLLVIEGEEFELTSSPPLEFVLSSPTY